MSMTVTVTQFSGGATISDRPYPYDILDNTGKVLVYKISKERWTGAYTYSPHYFITCGSELFSLKEGGIYQHNNQSLFNTFYGVQCKSRIMFVANKVPSEVKIVLSASVEGNVRPSFTHFRSEVPYEQSSDLVAGDYVDREGQFYAGLYRDRLSPNVTGTPDEKMLKGDRMRTAALRCMMEFSEVTAQVYVRFTNVTYNISSGHLN
jgi:hypothetical protein